MLHAPPKCRRPFIAAMLILVVGLAVTSPRAFAQGCMPIRYSSPALSAQNSYALDAEQWEIGLNYRLLHAEKFYVGHDYRPDAAPSGMPSLITVNTVELHLSYAPTSRFSVRLGVPIASGSHSVVEGDGLRHEDSMTGLGDVTLVGTMWLLDPPDHGDGNVAFGLGMKVPTGPHDAQATWYTTSTSQEQRTIDPSIQLGDGGWGTVLQGRAFRKVFKRTAAYMAGTYLANMGRRSGADWHLPSGTIAPMAVTDEYSAHAGLTFDVLPRRDLTLSFGGRVDGVPIHNLVAGSDDSFRRPGYALYAEPALSFTIRRSPLSPDGNSFTIGVPIRVDQNREASALDISLGKHGGGDFARALVFLGYSKRM